MNLRELQEWWTKLPEEWHYIFTGKQYMREDYIPIDKKKLRQVPFIKTLDIRFYGDHSKYNDLDLSPLKILAQLEDLSFSGPSLADLSPLQYCKWLRWLYFINGTNLNPLFTTLSNIEAIRHLKKLESLSFSSLKGAGEIGNLTIDLSIIGNLHCLVNLKLSDSWLTTITDLSPLNKLLQLTSLDIQNTSVYTLAAIWHLPLQKLYINGNISITETIDYQKEHINCNIWRYDGQSWIFPEQFKKLAKN